MIDWWGLFHNALWVMGLAVGLAALSMASYRARVTGIPLRRALNGWSFRFPFDAGMVLFCLGLLLSGRHWWEQILWGLLALLFAAQIVILWRERPRPAPTSPAEKAAAAGRLGRWLILLGLLIWLLSLIVLGGRLLGHARSLQAHLRQLEGLADDPAALDAATLDLAGQQLAGMHRDLVAIQSLAGPLLPAARLLGWLPVYGGDLAAAPDLLDLAVAVTAAGDRTFQALSPALRLLSDPASGPSDPSLGERLLPVLVAAQPELQAARRDLDAAQQARQRIETADLSPRVAGLLERLDRYLPLFAAALDGAALAPDLLGADGPRTYLILAQNSYELRPTGGFISGVGELTVDKGRLQDLSFRDSYRVDNFQVPHDLPPLDLQRTLYGQLWLFRDANWDPDFPTSARRALQIYANDQGVQADGVIALDLSALRLLVDALAPLQVEGLEQPVTGDNVLQTIEDEWNAAYARREELRGRWWGERKSFMGQIAGAAMDKVLSGQDVQPAALALALKQALDEKHILVYLDNPQAADLLRRQNWDGALIAPAAGDALLVVDTNVGFDKMDASVSRAIRYQVDLGDADGPQAQLTLTYHNRSSKKVECIQESRFGDSYRDMMERCYWNYVRVYVPSGSRLLRGPDLPLPSGSLLARLEADPPRPAVSPTLSLAGWEVWTAFFALEPQGTLTLTFDYTLPDRVRTGQAEGQTLYRLHVQKQPGTEAVPLRVDVALPPDAVVVEADPPDLPSVSTDLRTDRTFWLLFRDAH